MASSVAGWPRLLRDGLVCCGMDSSVAGWPRLLRDGLVCCGMASSEPGCGMVSSRKSPRRRGVASPVPSRSRPGGGCSRGRTARVPVPPGPYAPWPGRRRRSGGRPEAEADRPGGKLSRIRVLSESAAGPGPGLAQPIMIGLRRPARPGTVTPGVFTIMIIQCIHAGGSANCNGAGNLNPGPHAAGP